MDDVSETGSPSHSSVSSLNPDAVVYSDSTTRTDALLVERIKELVMTSQPRPVLLCQIGNDVMVKQLWKKLRPSLPKEHKKFSEYVKRCGDFEVSKLKSNILIAVVNSDASRSVRESVTARHSASSCAYSSDLATNFVLSEEQFLTKTRTLIESSEAAGNHVTLREIGKSPEVGSLWQVVKASKAGTKCKKLKHYLVDSGHFEVVGVHNDTVVLRDDEST